MNGFSQLWTVVAVALLCACSDSSEQPPVGGGGSAGGGGVGGAATGGAGGDTTGPCPNTIGPSMKKLPAGFCIDTTEVTRSQYEAWLAGAPDANAGPGPCSFNDDLTPTSGWPPGSDGQLPVVGVDWCDAAAFCASAGKRLCGQLGGGASAYEDYADPTRSQWFAGCTSGGVYDYTYGNTHDPEACRGNDGDQWASVEVGSLSGCQSPDPAYAGVFDLSGNVLEWEDACDGETGAEDLCRIRGGSFNYSGPGLRCDMGETLAFGRADRYVAVGFRCCAF